MLGVGRLGPLGRTDGPEVGSVQRPVETVGAGVAGASLAATGPVGGLDATERDAWIVLVGVAGVGPVSFGRLVAAFGSAAAVLSVARRSGATTALVAATGSEEGGSPTLAWSSAAGVVAAALDPSPWLVPVRRSGVGILTLADEAYPRRLRRVDLPPPVLFLHGDAAALDRPRAIAIVGAPRPPAGGGGAPRRRNGCVHRVGSRHGDRRRRPCRRGPPRRAHDRGHRRWPRATVPGRAPRSRPGHRGWRRRCGERVPAGHDPDQGDVPTPQPDHQRPRGRHDRR